MSLFVLTIDPPRQQAAEVQMTESVEQPALAEGSGEEEMAHLVLNQEAVEPEPVKDSFCLLLSGRINGKDKQGHQAACRQHQ